MSQPVFGIFTLALDTETEMSCGRLVSNCPLIAMVEQQLPLNPSYLTAEIATCRFSAYHRFAKVHKPEGIPRILTDQVLAEVVRVVRFSQLASLPAQFVEDFVIAHATEPVL